MIYMRFPLSLRNVEDPLHERGTDICQKSVRLLNEVFVKINEVQHDLWSAVDHEGEVLESHVSVMGSVLI